MKLTTTTTSDDMSFSVPKEIMIKTFVSEEQHQNQHQQQEIEDRSMKGFANKNIASFTPPSCSITSGMDWEKSLPQQESQMEFDDEPRFSGCVVSLPSSDCSSQDCTSLISVDPLDYRKDWSKELFETDFDPQLFVLNEERQAQFQQQQTKSMRTISDSNSLCSCLSEEYEMDSDDNMTGLWDGEKHDISIPEWVSAQHVI